MEHEHINDSPPELPPRKQKESLLPASIIVAGLLISVAIIYAVNPGIFSRNASQKVAAKTTTIEEETVIPSGGIALPVAWGDLGKQMTASGVIDQTAFEELYASRGGISPDMQKLLSEDGNGRITITPQNATTLLNLLWAFGLGNKNAILEKGPMSDPQYGGAGQFASTGGWTLAKGDTMKHYSAHAFVSLTAEQQQLVERVSKGIFRPCCGNDTYFPDCNHGMAMLGLLELMASQGVNEADMYKTALAVNSYWFPSTYLTIASYLQERGITWDKVNPQEILGAQYSSASGYRQILSEVEPTPSRGGPSCGA